MITYTCDKCGATTQRKGIVGSEYKWFYDSGFQTLQECFRDDGIVDLCKECYKQKQDIRRKAREEARKFQRGRERELSGSPPVTPVIAKKTLLQKIFGVP